MSSGSCCKVVSRTSLAPTVYELSCTAGEACSHVGIAEGKDLTFLIYTLSYNKLEVSVAILGDCKVSNGSKVRIELGQLSAAGLSVEYLNDLHGRLLVRNISIAGSAVTDDSDIVIEVDGIHLS